MEKARVSLSGVEDSPRRRAQQAIQLAGSIDRNLLARERELLNTKWFDYRLMSPIDTTLTFIKAFYTVYKRSWAREISAEESERRHGLRPGRLPTDPATLTSVWKARQFADSLCAPYELFLDATFRLWLDAGHRLPRPNQIYAADWEKNIKEKVVGRLLELSESTPQWSRLPQYRSDASVATALRDQHVAWCLHQLKLHHGKPYQVARAVYGLKLVPEDVASAEFGAEVMQRAGAETLDAASMPDTVASKKSQFMPSCAFLPQAFDPDAKTGQSCHYIDNCSDWAPRLSKLIEQKHGSDDPRRDRKLEQGRIRIQNHRAKKRAAALGRGHA